MKSAGEAVEILEAFDLTGSLRAVGRASTDAARRSQLVDPNLAKVEEGVERSHGKVRADWVNSDWVNSTSCGHQWRLLRGQ